VSEALDWLVAVRPGPMQAYFSFLKQAGGSLDPKTRSLISVITKVGAQTERGFRQYLKRALRDGCSADEIIDALLMAFPLLGLTRIVWAIDQIIAMDLPQFDRDRLAGVLSATAGDGEPEAWADIGAVEDFAIDALAHVPGPAGGCFVRRLGDGFNVFSANCPHKNTPLTLADLNAKKTCIRCPRHDWRFDAVDGSPRSSESEALPALEYRVEGGRLQVLWLP
jgi:nitrite reductase/ring-hydroxylating ferredoxin subunit